MEIRMPSSYAVIEEEEMTYLDGGASTGATVGFSVAACVGIYSWLQGLFAIRDYRRANPNTWTQTGLSALADDMSKGTWNIIRDVYRSFEVVSTSLSIFLLPVNALIIFS